MINFKHLVDRFAEDRFDMLLKVELEQLEHSQLPLQAGLCHSSYVSDRPFSAIILKHEISDNVLRIKAGICYTGIIAGCSCADDPSPVDETNEYCELLVLIDRLTGATDFQLL